MTSEPSYSVAPPQQPKAPVVAMWICMLLALALFVAPIPFTVILAIPLNLAAFILAIMCITRSRVGQGVIGLIGTTVVAGVLYLVGWGLMAAGAVAMSESAIVSHQTEAVRAVAAASNVETVQASALARSFGNDMEGTKRKWQNKVLRVEGVVDSSVEMFGRSAIVLGPKDSSSAGVLCFFEKSSPGVASLKNGDKVAVVGQGELEYGGVMLFGARLAE